MTNYVLGIDPGPTESGLVWFDYVDLKIHYSDIIKNDMVVDFIKNECGLINCVGVEKMVSYGMPVGASVFETCYWIGEFRRLFLDYGIKFYLITKPEVSLHFCNTRKAKTSNLMQIMKDRFGDKGTKKNPGILYNLSKHKWSAFFVALYIADVHLTNCN